MRYRETVAFWNTNNILVEKTFLNNDMATLATKSLTVWRCVFIFQCSSVGYAFRFGSPPGLMHILSVISQQPNYYKIPASLAYFNSFPRHREKRCSVNLNVEQRFHTG